MTGSLILLALGLSAPVAPPVQAHEMQGHAMPGMTMPATPARPKARSRKTPRTTGAMPPSPQRSPDAAPPAAAAAIAPCAPEHAAMGHCAMAAPEPAPVAAPDPCPPEHAAMGHCQPGAPVPSAGASAGTDQPAGTGAAPPPPTDRAADAFYPPATMTEADRAMRIEHGGMAFSQVMLNIAEMQVRNGRDGYRWDGEAWFGGDIHRLVVKSEGEGSFGSRLDAGEVQALYSRTLDPYWNLQAGVRQDIGRGRGRTYATAGVEGLAPYWFDVEAAVFLSNRGDLLGRVEAYYDQRITQRLILQPRAEFTLAAQDMPDMGLRSGLASSELGLRIRYELRRELAPYAGIHWEDRRGNQGAVAGVVGIRMWF